MFSSYPKADCLNLTERVAEQEAISLSTQVKLQGHEI